MPLQIRRQDPEGGPGPCMTIARSTMRNSAPPTHHDQTPPNPHNTVLARGRFIRVRSANRPVRSRAMSHAVLADPQAPVPRRAPRRAADRVADADARRPEKRCGARWKAATVAHRGRLHRLVDAMPVDLRAHAAAEGRDAAPYRARHHEVRREQRGSVHRADRSSKTRVKCSPASLLSCSLRIRNPKS